MIRFVTATLFAASACRADGGGALPEVARPAPATASLRIREDSLIPRDPVGAAIRRGRAILAATADSLPANVGNALRCTSCHLRDGTTTDAAPWVGVYSRFPQYRSRNAKVNQIQDRINDCFQRSLNGKALAWDSPDMAAIVAYLAFLSRGVAPPGDVPGQGFRKMEPLRPDTAHGRLVYAGQCARCHGGDGQGMTNPDPTGSPRYYPPVFGPRSFNVGAGMARLRTAASFVRFNMPFDRPGTITDQDAFDVAGYLVTRPRPDFVGKEHDWPKGDPPPDVAYSTPAGPAKAPR